MTSALEAGRPEETRSVYCHEGIALDSTQHITDEWVRQKANRY